MKCDMPKEQLIGYLYEDMDPGEKESIEAHLAQCPACKRELELLAGTSHVLRAWPDEALPMNLVFVQERTSIWRWLMPDWLREGGWRRLTVGLAAGLASVMVILALVNLEATYTQGDFSLKLSLLPRSAPESIVSQDPWAAPVARREFSEWQQQSLQLIKEMLHVVEERQRGELDLALAQLAQNMDRQRRQDLHLVGKGLEVVELSTEDRFRRNDEILQRLFTMAQFQMSPPNALRHDRRP